MDENLRMAAKFKNYSILIFFVFVLLTIVLSVTFSCMFNNYWLLFGIPCSLYLSKIGKLFLFSIIPIIVYWLESGFHFSNEITFFWIASLFGSIFQLIVKSYEDLADKIIDNKVSGISSDIQKRIQYRNEMLNKKFYENQ